MKVKLIHIEDNEFDSFIFQKFVESIGYEYRRVSCPETFLDKINCDDYDIIVTDWEFPFSKSKKYPYLGMQGQELCENLKKNKVKTPIIIMTIDTEIKTKYGESVLKYVDDVIEKPGSPETIKEIIERLLKKNTG